jgi:type IV secretion system protein VirB10
MIGVVVALSIGAVWYIFFSDEPKDKTTQAEQQEQQEEIQRLLERAEVAPQNFETRIDVTPKLPKPPPLIIPSPPPPPPMVTLPKTKEGTIFVPPIKTEKATKAPTVSEISNDDSDLKARRNSNMLAFGGSITGGEGSGIGAGIIDPTDPTRIVNKDTIRGLKSIFTEEQNHPDVNATPQKSSASQVAATYSGPREHIISQGKIIDIVLESAINTDLPGTLRGIVSRDVYSEAGQSVLIPKGSRIIGEYDSAVTPGESRIAIVWDRIILPDGVDIQVDSEGIDQLGRSGIPGDVDTKFLQVIRNSLLFSAITLGSGVILDKVAGGSSENNKITTNTDKDGKTTTTGRPIDLAIRDVTGDVSGILKDYITQYSNPKPTIRINQGMPMKVFVNKDLIFSKHINRIIRK